MSTVDPHAQLEQSYRRLLWLFPPSYRRARGRELIDVLMERADPGQRKPSPAESVALLRFSARTWACRAISPTPAAARDAMGLLAVVLPMVLLFPAATALYIDARVGRFGMSELPFGADIPAWLLWCVTALLCVFGRPSWARWSAATGVAAYLVAAVIQYADNNFSTVANALGWLGVQVVATVALASPAWVVHGRSQVRRWWAAAIGVAAAGGGLAVSSADQFRLSIGDYSWVSLVAVLLALVAGGVALLSAAGRAALPIIAGLVAFMVAAKYVAGGLGNNLAGQSGPRGHFGVSEIVVLSAAPLVVSILARAITAGANHRFPTRGGPAHATMNL
ncbi:hypothetical protein ABIB25_003678 [Nakamurella sp. UYEF19]|uniref:hypothetical protein n=1 Tax=Nakamurella sp. UYEF19 TaxID=1756392 RepID=UPI0033985D15